MMTWRQCHPEADVEMLGFVPMFFDDTDPASARDQINMNYSHGGGWQPFPGIRAAVDFMSLHFPGDPPYVALYETRLRDERIILYDHKWLAIIQPDHTYEIARVD